jgi:triacylglycerol esterase/lipase EstA (alpha/beta hydrolase family)
VAGLLAPSIAYQPLSARLRGDGYRTFVYQLPGLGFGDMRRSAAALCRYVDEVRAQTRAAKLDVVAHSEGGLVTRECVKSFGGSEIIDKVITLGTPNYGTIMANIAAFLTFGTCIGSTACVQMKTGSSFLETLNAGDDSIDAVRYWNYANKLDELVQPYRNSFLASSDGNIVNVALQDRCWLRVVGHLFLALDGTVYSGVEQALQGHTRPKLRCFAL